MIKVSENKVALYNIGTTIKALETLDYLFKEYSKPLVGPAYVHLKHVATEHSEIQLDRRIMVKALVQQRQEYIDYLANLGIDYDVPLDLSGIAETLPSDLADLPSVQLSEKPL